ncbi:MAG: hypothetical protein QW273_03390 [Candidatus Pacearchaeota archaeon]
MIKRIALSFISFMFFIYFSSSNENLMNGSLDVIVTLPATQEWAEIELNISEINFGIINLSKEISSSEKEVRTKYKIRNRGNINISVVPILEKDDSIFRYLEFGRTYTSGWFKIGTYQILMNKSKEDGSWNPWFEQSIKLNLKNYVEEQGEIPFDIVNHKARVIFWVLPRYD